MTPERYKRVIDLFEAASQRKPETRPGFLMHACAGDQDLRREVEAMLVADGESGRGLLDQPADDLAAAAVLARSLIGQRISHYEVVSRLGAGGMGEVYRAKDARLNREVAIKIANASFSDRFEREARAVAALNHPNICTLHDVGSNYLVMELVEGPTLAERIKRGALPVDDALRIARQIAAALEAAHEKGIVHRDLKPANIEVKMDGTVKVLDFGLAKITPDPAKKNSEQTHTQTTRLGVVIGTAAYMSPEQASGSQVGRHSDVWAFGVVLFEMLTGKRMFAGESTSQTLAEVLTKEPDWTQLPIDVPQSIQRMLRRCLARDLKRRLPDIGSARLEIDEALEGRESPASITSAPTGLMSVTRGAAVMGIALTLIAVGFVIHAWVFTPPYMNLATYRYTPIVLAGDGGVLNRDPAPAWAPDGKGFVYAAEDRLGRQQLFLQSLDSQQSSQLTRESWATWGIFAPDGKRVYYIGQKEGPREVWSISTAGGIPELLFPSLGGNEPLDGLAVSRDGKALVFAKMEDGKLPMSLWISSPPGAPPYKYPGGPSAKIRPFQSARLRFSPDGRWLLAMLYEKEPYEFWLLPWPPKDAGSGNRRILSQIHGWEGHSSADWMPDSRHLVLAGGPGPFRGGGLWLADIETDKLFPLSASDTGYWLPQVNPQDGRILLARMHPSADIVEIPLDGSAVHNLIATSLNESYPAWSPASEQLVYVTNRRGADEIWLSSQREGWHRPVVTQSNMPSGRHEFYEPVWAPDGLRIAYTTEDNAIWISQIAGGSATPLLPKGVLGNHPTWSPDGVWIAFRQGINGKHYLSKQKVGSNLPVTVISSAAGGFHPTWSPDGHWITIQLPGGFGVVSPDGKQKKVIFPGEPGNVGSACGWSRDSHTLYLGYLKGKDLILSGFDIRTGAENKIANLGRKRFSFELLHAALLSESPDRKSLVASFMSVESDIWMIEGIAPTPDFWRRLFWRPGKH